MLGRLEAKRFCGPVRGRPFRCAGNIGTDHIYPRNVVRGYRGEIHDRRCARVLLLRGPLCVSHGDQAHTSRARSDIGLAGLGSGSGHIFLFVRGLLMLIKVNLGALRKTKGSEYLVRFMLGGAVTVLTGLIASHYGPAIGGFFLAFPAIFPASATLVERHERDKKHAGGDFEYLARQTFCCVGRPRRITRRHRPHGVCSDHLERAGDCFGSAHLERRSADLVCPCDPALAAATVAWPMASIFPHQTMTACGRSVSCQFCPTANCENRRRI